MLSGFYLLSRALGFFHVKRRCYIENERFCNIPCEEITNLERGSFQRAQGGEEPDLRDGPEAVPSLLSREFIPRGVGDFPVQMVADGQTTACMP